MPGLAPIVLGSAHWVQQRRMPLSSIGRDGGTAWDLFIAASYDKLIAAYQLYNNSSNVLHFSSL